MINKEQYQLLKEFSNLRLNVENNNFDNDALQDLLNSKIIEISSYTPFPTYNLITEYRITDKGKSAIEEYERMLIDIDNQKEALRIAQESNNIATVSNKKARNSNIIAWFAVIVSAIAVLVSLCH